MTAFLLADQQANTIRLRHRLIAVWALAEAVLGGILHGLHLPVTGLVVGSISVCCLALLSRLQPKPGQLLKATLVVLLVKAMLSPHTPIGAYVAVLSQGLLAELFFRSRKHFRASCFGFGLITQLQSGIQHLVVLTVVFGTGLWQAIDQYLNKISETWGMAETSYSVYFAGFYLLAHAVAGLIVGWVAGKLPAWLPKKGTMPALKPVQAPTVLEPFLAKENHKPEIQKAAKHKPGKLKIKPGLAVIWLLLLAVFLQSYFGIGPEVLPQGKIARLLIRSVLVVSAWYFLISPLLLKVFHNWLAQKKGPLQTELSAVLDLLPETGALLRQLWQEQRNKSGLSRIQAFTRETVKQLFAMPPGS